MSRFVSAGSADEPKEADEAWLKAQQQIEATRQQIQKPRPGEQEGGKSLYDTLQANKAAKQEAFEEQNRLRNQFRSLDDDEIEFLDSVLGAERAKEREVKKETGAQLEAFRRQQEDAEKAAKGPGGDVEVESMTETWTAGPRKRKKGREGVLGGVKVRRMSTAEKHEDAVASTSKATSADAGSLQPSDLPALKKEDEPTTAESAPPPKSAAASPSPQPSPPKPAPTGLGLAAYSSDEED